MNLQETYNVFYATWRDFSLFVCGPQWRSFLPLSPLALTNLGILQFIQNSTPPRLIALSNTGKILAPFTKSLSIVALSSGFRWANLLTLSKYDCSTRCSYGTLRVILKSSLIIVGPLCLLNRWLTQTHSFRITQLRTQNFTCMEFTVCPLAQLQNSQYSIPLYCIIPVYYAPVRSVSV